MNGRSKKDLFTNKQSNNSPVNTNLTKILVMNVKNIIRDAIRNTGAKQYYYILNDRFTTRYERLLLKISPARFFRYRYKRFLHKKLNLKYPTAYNEKLIGLS